MVSIFFQCFLMFSIVFPSFSVFSHVFSHVFRCFLAANILCCSANPSANLRRAARSPPHRAAGRTCIRPAAGDAPGFWSTGWSRENPRYQWMTGGSPIFFGNLQMIICVQHLHVCNRKNKYTFSHAAAGSQCNLMLCNVMICNVHWFHITRMPMIGSGYRCIQLPGQLGSPAT